MSTSQHAGLISFYRTVCTSGQWKGLARFRNVPCYFTSALIQPISHLKVIRIDPLNLFEVARPLNFSFHKAENRKWDIVSLWMMNSWPFHNLKKYKHSTKYSSPSLRWKKIVFNAFGVWYLNLTCFYYSFICTLMFAHVDNMQLHLFLYIFNS